MEGEGEFTDSPWTGFDWGHAACNPVLGLWDEFPSMDFKESWGDCWLWMQTPVGEVGVLVL